MRATKPSLRGDRLSASTIDLPFVREQSVFGDKPALWHTARGDPVYGLRRDPDSGEIEVARCRLEVSF